MPNQNATPTTDNRLAVDEREAAAIIGVSVAFLRKDRLTKRRIPFYRLGDRILYNIERLRETLSNLEEGGQHIRRGRPASKTTTAVITS